jgi:SAM-dependent methyltransferase
MPDLAALYRYRFRESDLPEKNRIWKTLCESYFQKRIDGASIVLDLACGYGEFINNIGADRKIGVDLNPDVRRFLDPAVEFHNIQADALGAIGESVADLVFTSNFLEHLRSKEELDAVFAAVLKVLKPGGRFMIMGPNIKYLAGAYWDFYDHYLPLSHISVEEGLAQSGFEVVETIARFLPYTTRSALPKASILIAGYVNMPLAWPLLGKQFLVTGRKPLSGT